MLEKSAIAALKMAAMIVFMAICLVAAYYPDL